MSINKSNSAEALGARSAEQNDDLVTIIVRPGFISLSEDPSSKDERVLVINRDNVFNDKGESPRWDNELPTKEYVMMFAKGKDIKPWTEAIVSRCEQIYQKHVCFNWSGMENIKIQLDASVLNKLPGKWVTKEAVKFGGLPTVTTPTGLIQDSWDDVHEII